MIWDEEKYKQEIELLKQKIEKLEDENNRLLAILNTELEDALKKPVSILDAKTTNEIFVFEKIMEEGMK